MSTQGTAITFGQLVKSLRSFAPPLDRIREATHPMGKLYHKPLPSLLDVTRTISKGETVRVPGPDGVGKSTLLHTVAGALNRSSRTATVSGNGSFIKGAGIAASPRRTGSIREVVLRLANDKPLREQMGRDARARSVATGHSADDATTIFRAFLETAGGAA